MSRSIVRAFRVPAAVLMLLGSATVAAPAFADNDFVVLSGSSLTEGDSGQSELVFTASVANAPSAPITMRFTALPTHSSLQPNDAVPGSACGGNVDFVAVDGTITIPTTSNHVAVSVPVCGDTAIEQTESFTAIVRDVQGAGAYCLELCAAFGTIIDNDTAQPVPIVVPQPTLSVSNTSLTEGAAALLLVQPKRAMNFAVTLSAAASAPVTVDYSTGMNKGLPGTTATSGAQCAFGVDFVSRAATLQFNPGETHKTVSVTVCGDTVNEANETMVLRLSNPVGATLADSVGVGTIVDDD